MKKLLATVTSVVFMASLSASVSSAQTSCPPEVAQAKSMIEQRQARTQDVNAPRSLAGARAQDVNAPRTQDVNAPRVQEVQAPRSLAGARTQDVSAPRTQDVNAPRSQGVQAPRTQDVNAPRTQDVNAPRTQDVNAPRGQDGNAPRADFSRATSLVREAEAACKAGNSGVASEKARAAMDLIK
jgi:hypothetical protein